MRVLGLDPGSRRTGFGVVERSGNTMRALAAGIIQPGAKLELPARIGEIGARTAELVEQWSPECIVIEEAFYHESVRSTLVLGHVRGALILVASQHDVAIAEYSPREIKLSVAGSGAASKEQVAFMVRRILGWTGTLQVDASDALGAAICHLQRTRHTPVARAASAAADRLTALLAKRGRR
jgi:crossover junction endodeoxyribonuclease RuvC